MVVGFESKARVGRSHVRGIGFDENAVRRELSEDLADFGFARVEKVSGKREKGGEGEALASGFERSAEGMEEKRGEGSGTGLEFGKESAPCFEAVDGEGAIEVVGEGEVAAEDRELVGKVRIFHPAIESAFANCGVGEFFEVGREVVFPDGRTVGDFPWVEAEGGDDKVGEGFGESGDDGPVGFGGSVDDAGGDAMGLHGFDEVGLLAVEAGILEVIVGIDHGARSRS